MAVDPKVPQGENPEVHPVAEALGSRPDEDIVKGPPAADDAFFVRVGSADDPFEADLLTDALDEAQIPVIARASRDHVMDTLVVTAPNFWDIMVPREYEERARGIVEMRKVTIERDADDAARAAEEEAEGGETKG
jgi:hypothetical protein